MILSSLVENHCFSCSYEEEEEEEEESSMMTFCMARQKELEEVAPL